MLLDLVDRMLGKVLANFCDDPLLHVGMKRISQICQGPRRRDYDECLGLALTHELFHRCGDAMNEAMLLELVPVGISLAAAEVRAGAFESAAGPVSATVCRYYCSRCAFSILILRFASATGLQHLLFH